MLPRWNTTSSSAQFVDAGDARQCGVLAHRVAARNGASTNASARASQPPGRPATVAIATSELASDTAHPRMLVVHAAGDQAGGLHAPHAAPRSPARRGERVGLDPTPHGPPWTGADLHSHALVLGCPGRGPAAVRRGQPGRWSTLTSSTLTFAGDSENLCAQADPVTGRPGCRPRSPGEPMLR